jgi:hypothetical protein
MTRQAVVPVFSMLFFGANRVKIGNMSAARIDLLREIKKSPARPAVTSSPGDVNAIEQVSEFIFHKRLYLCIAIRASSATRKRTAGQHSLQMAVGAATTFGSYLRNSSWGSNYIC